jgi:hypothetical protein
MSITVLVLVNTPEMKRGTESLPKVFLHNNREQIYFILFYCLSHKEEMRCCSHFTKQNMFLPGDGENRGGGRGGRKLWVTAFLFTSL